MDWIYVSWSIHQYVISHTDQGITEGATLIVSLVTETLTVQGLLMQVTKQKQVKYVHKQPFVGSPKFKAVSVN